MDAFKEAGREGGQEGDAKCKYLVVCRSASWCGYEARGRRVTAPNFPHSPVWSKLQLLAYVETPFPGNENELISGVAFISHTLAPRHAYITHLAPWSIELSRTWHSIFALASYELRGGDG